MRALGHFEKAMAAHPTSLCASYYAYCIAKERGHVKKGIALCREALEKEPGTPVHYLNLARIHLLGHNMHDAITVLREGMQHAPDPEIHRSAGSYRRAETAGRVIIASRQFRQQVSGTISCQSWACVRYYSGFKSKMTSRRRGSRRRRRTASTLRSRRQANEDARFRFGIGISLIRWSGGERAYGTATYTCATMGACGTLALGKLIFIYDDNLISLDGPTKPELHRGRAGAVRGLPLARAAGKGRQRPGSH